MALGVAQTRVGEIIMAGFRATLGSLGDDPGLGVRLKGLKVGEEDEESEIDEEEVREI